jgi:hypothetical protein
MNGTHIAERDGYTRTPSTNMTWRPAPPPAPHSLPTCFPDPMVPYFPNPYFRPLYLNLHPKST